MVIDTAAARITTEHLVQFYKSEDELSEQLVGLLVDAAACGDTAIVVATGDHRSAVESRLAALGADYAPAAGSVTLLDAATTLRQFYDGTALDPSGFDRVIGGLVRRAAEAGRPVRIYGEMVAVLWDAGQINAAIELEELWNELAGRLSFTLLCGYPVTAADAGSEPIERVCRAHTAVHGRPAQARELTRDFAPTTAASAGVREFVASALGEWDARRWLDDLQLIATELVTNAVRHARSGVTVTLSATDDRLRVSVADGSASLPAPRSSDQRSLSGRGLRIVDVIATSWGYDRRPVGKVVWAEIDRAGERSD